MKNIFSNIGNIFQPKNWDILNVEEKDTPGKRAFSYDMQTDADVIAQGIDGNIVASEYLFANIPSDELELIYNYRSMILDAEVYEAFSEIRNEIFVFNEGHKPFEIDFAESSKIPDKVRTKIVEEFETVYKLLDFNNKGSDLFKNWYVDSRLVFHKIINEDKPNEGIQQLMRLDPVTIRKIRQLPKPDAKGLYNPDLIREFYIYNPTNIENKKNMGILTLGYDARIFGLKISPENITFVDSGEYDAITGKSIGYLHKSIAPLNQLRGMEDVMMIYRLARAPSRRAFYIDCGGLGKASGQAYVDGLAKKFASKMVYDPKTGSLINKKSILAITEDFWLPRREGRGTEVSNLDGQDTSNIIEEVKYYKDRFYASLAVPRSRFDQENAAFNFGKGVEIDREEYRFTKFLSTLRQRFMPLFLDLMHTNLVLKGIIEKDEWENIKTDIVWKFQEDNNFVEWKKAEVLSSRISIMRDAADIIGKIVSQEWAAKNIFKMTDEEYKEQKELIKKEKEENPPEVEPEF